MVLILSLQEIRAIAATPLAATHTISGNMSFVRYLSPLIVCVAANSKKPQFVSKRTG